MINRNLLGRGYATACVEVMKLVILVKVTKMILLKRIKEVDSYS